MLADSRIQQSPNDDIDLIVLVEKSVSFFRKYFWIFISATILGIAAGIFMFKWLPNVYKSKLVLHSFILTNPEQMQIVSNWNALLGNGEYAALARVFNVSEETLKPLKRIKAEEIQKVFTSENPNGFYIEVTVSDNSVLDELQKGILHGLRNSEYINAKLRQRRADLGEMIRKTEEEIRRIDTTRSLLDGMLRGKSNSSSAMIVDAGSINRQWLEVNERLLGFKAELQFADAVQVLQSFSRFEKPSGPKLIPWIVIGLVLFLGLAFAYATISTIRHRIALRAKMHPVN